MDAAKQIYRNNVAAYVKEIEEALLWYESENPAYACGTPLTRHEIEEGVRRCQMILKEPTVHI